MKIIISSLLILLCTQTLFAQKNKNVPPKKQMIKVQASVNYSASYSHDTADIQDFGQGNTIKKKSDEQMTSTGKLSLSGEVEYQDEAESFSIQYRFDPASTTKSVGYLTVSGGYDEKDISNSEETFTAPLVANVTEDYHSTDNTNCHQPGAVNLEFSIDKKTHEAVCEISVNFKGKSYTTGTLFAKGTMKGKMVGVPSSGSSTERDDETPRDAEHNVSASGSTDDKTMKVTITPNGYTISGQYSETSSRGEKEMTTYSITIGVPPPKDVEVRNMETQHPHCVFTDSTDKVVELTAVAKTGTGQIQIDSFEVKKGSKPCVVLKNQGGKSPILILKGCAKNTEKTTIIAIYKKGGKQERSEPFELNWSYLEKPEFPETFTPYNDPMKKKEYFVFSKDIPVGDVTIDAKTKLWLNGTENKTDQVEWEIAPNNNNMFVPEDYKNGREVKIRAKKLPTDNNDFGTKKIKAKFNSQDCQIESEETELKLFFPRDAKNNPDAKEPNWFYYWKQTSAWITTGGYEFIDDIPNPKNGGTPQKGEVARYEPYNDILYFSPYLLKKGALSAPGEKARNGIDAFGTCARHENEHRTEYLAWWGMKMINYKKTEDCDGDEVPNWIEEKMAGCKTGCYMPVDAGGGMDAIASWMLAATFSCNARPFDNLPDIEYNAYYVGWKWKIASADKEDWAFPGHQCPEGHQGR